MKDSIMLTVTITILYILYHTEAIDVNADGSTRTSKAHNKVFGKQPGSGPISFNSEEQKLRIDWAITIPFISIPFDHKIGENGEISPLLNVNTKPLGIVGLVATLLSLITPLFSKTHTQHKYRSEDNMQWSQMGNIVNEMIFHNNYVIPCIQQIVCSIVSLATHSKNPTSTDKIIDGLSSYKWFKDFTNGTIIEEAIATGQTGNHDCAHTYKNCLIVPNVLKTMMNEFGIM